MSDERDFLHALANPLAIAVFLIDALTEELGEDQRLSESQRQQIKDITDSLQAMNKLLGERRESIRKRKSNEAA